MKLLLEILLIVTLTAFFILFVFVGLLPAVYILKVVFMVNFFACLTTIAAYYKMSQSSTN